MNVSVEQFGDVRALRYEYDCCEDASFSFNLLCEVGEPWQAEAKAQAKALAIEMGCAIGEARFDHDPWVVDALVPL